MLGKTHWFKRRKYTGWGLFPATWQGWVYIAIAVGLIMLVQALPLDTTVRTILTSALIAVLVLDIIDIMRKLPLDERDRIHEAIAERNALWVIITALAAGICWQACTSAIANSFQVDPVIIVALTAGVIAKAITNIYLDRKD